MTSTSSTPYPIVAHFRLRAAASRSIGLVWRLPFVLAVSWVEELATTFCLVCKLVIGGVGSGVDEVEPGFEVKGRVVADFGVIPLEPWFPVDAGVPDGIDALT